MFDLVVVGAVALGAFAGWRRGFVTPLIAVAASLVGLYTLYAGPGQSLVPGGTAGIGLGVIVVTILGGFVLRFASMLVGVVHRVSVLKAGDHVLGVPLGAATALVSVYVALVAVVSFDGLLAPFHGKPTIDEAAVAALKTALAANPQYGVMIDQGTLDAMAAQVTTSAIPADQVAKFDQTLALYEDDVRPALLHSALAPVILGVGEHVPFIGRHVTFPTQ
ncbi:MAG TPA: hypothetical protein VI814_05460 [Candidatus Limnocylindria bacterium]